MNLSICIFSRILVVILSEVDYNIFFYRNTFVGIVHLKNKR